MATPSNASSFQQTEQLLADLRALRHFNGAPEKFWDEYLQAAARLALAQRALLLTADAAGAFTLATAWPVPPPGQFLDAKLVKRGAALAATAMQRGCCAERAPKEPKNAGALTAFKLDEGPGLPTAVVVLQVNDAPIEQLEAATIVLRLTADIPTSYLKDRALRETTGETLRFADAFDLMILLNQDQRYGKATLTLCNELASRYRCSRVSLGWMEGAYARLQTMSHVEKFERRTSAVQLLEAAMEEAAEQDEEIVFPRAPGPGPVTRAHAEYAREMTVGHVVSLPLRLEEEVLGVLTCERQEGAFHEEEVRGLRLVLGQATRRIADLKRHDVWIGARLSMMAKEGLALLLGPKHTFAKVTTILVALLAAYVVNGSWEYRIDAPFILKTDDLIAVPAPFDGYIAEAKVRIGDEVKAGEVMLALDTRELLLEEASATAEISRYTWEAEKQRSRNELVDMKISQAIRAQAQARYDKVHHQLENARVKAPFAGVVVEGDLKKMLGAPVRKGDLLFKVARLERLYAELDVPERDLRDIREKMTGEIVFVTRPELAFQVETQVPDPVATTKENENVVVMRANPKAPAPWWRPGMSGVAKLDVGPRKVWWILLHRTIDYLRLWAWW